MNRLKECADGSGSVADQVVAAIRDIESFVLAREAGMQEKAGGVIKAITEQGCPLCPCPTFGQCLELSLAGLSGEELVGRLRGLFADGGKIAEGVGREGFNDMGLK